jgi:hypothetical protein
MLFRKHSTVAIALLLGVFIAPNAYCQQPTDGTTRSVEQAAFERTQNAAQQTVKFGRRPARVGDEVEHTVSLETRLKTSLRQGNEFVGKNQLLVLTDQQRRVTSTEVDQDRVIAVEVHFLVATKQITAPHLRPQPTSGAQPVQGKTYRCRRAGGENAQLIVTDLKGQTPPSDECEIVAQTMDMVGRPNPLAQFLAGRKVAIGETIELPKELANQIFNLGDRLCEVTRFELTLEKVDTHNGAPSATFLARVEAASNDSSQMRLQVEGPLVVEAGTCRAMKLALTGPIGMSETRGSYSTVYQLLGTGQLQVSIESAYRDAR